MTGTRGFPGRRHYKPPKLEDIMPMCEVCSKNEAAIVASIPGVPYSAGYCRECLKCNAHPYAIMVGNTALLGGLDRAAEFWREMVRCTLARLLISDEKFDADVKAAMMEEGA